jgi:hypothetical protein
VSLKVMPVFQMSGILPLKTSPDGRTKTLRRAHLRIRNSTARFSACEPLCDQHVSLESPAGGSGWAVPDCAVANVSKASSRTCRNGFPHCFETASRGSLWRLETFFAREVSTFAGVLADELQRLVSRVAQCGMADAVEATGRSITRGENPQGQEHGLFDHRNT